jgi:hypothetical protein
MFFTYGVIILLLDLPISFYIWRGENCFYPQILFTTIGPQIGLLIVFVMFLERAYISMGFQSNGTLGFILSLFSVILPPAVQVPMFNPKQYENERVFCGSPLTTFDPKIITYIYFGMIFDFSITLLDFSLLLYNKRKIQAYK